MSRQQRRAAAKSVSKKIGQLRSIQHELATTNDGRVMHANLKRLAGIRQDLVDMGVARYPTKWERFKGKVKDLFKRR